MALASWFSLVRLVTRTRAGSRSRGDRPGRSNDPAEIGHQCPMLEIGQIDPRLGRKQHRSVILGGRNAGGIEVAFIPEQDLTRPEQAGLMFVNPLEPVAEAVGKG